MATFGWSFLLIFGLREVRFCQHSRLPTIPGPQVYNSVYSHSVNPVSKRDQVAITSIITPTVDVSTATLLKSPLDMLAGGFIVKE